MSNAAPELAKARATAPVGAEASGLVTALAAAAATSLGGAAIVGTRYLVGHVDPLTLAFLRYGIATICLLPLVLVSAQRSVVGRDWVAVFGLGIVYFCVHPFLFTLGLKYTSASLGALVLASTPMLTLILSGLLGYEKVTPRKVIGIAVALAGVAAAVADGAQQEGSLSWMGNGIMFAAACAGATYNVVSRPILQRNSALTVLGYGMAAGTLVLATLLLVQGRLGGIVELDLDGPSWAVLVATGTFGAALAFYLLLWALRRTTPTKVTVFLTLNPVVAMLLGAAVLGESVTVIQLVGLVLVLSGILLVNTTSRTR